MCYPLNFAYLVLNLKPNLNLNLILSTMISSTNFLINDLHTYHYIHLHIPHPLRLILLITSIHKSLIPLHSARSTISSHLLIPHLPIPYPPALHPFYHRVWALICHRPSQPVEGAWTQNLRFHFITIVKEGCSLREGLRPLMGGTITLTLSLSRSLALSL